MSKRKPAAPVVAVFGQETRPRSNICFRSGGLTATMAPIEAAPVRRDCLLFAVADYDVQRLYLGYTHVVATIDKGDEDINNVTNIAVGVIEHAAANNIKLEYLGRLTHREAASFGERNGCRVLWPIPSA